MEMKWVFLVKQNNRSKHVLPGINIVAVYIDFILGIYVIFWFFKRHRTVEHVRWSNNLLYYTYYSLLHTQR